MRTAKKLRGITDVTCHVIDKGGGAVGVRLGTAQLLQQLSVTQAVEIEVLGEVCGLLFG